MLSAIHACLTHCTVNYVYTGYVLKFLNQVLRLVSYLSAFKLQLITVWYVNQPVET